jgi:single-strand DNA-binding protein
VYLNHYVCAGNLTADPVLHYTKGGKPWCSGGVALNKPIPPREEGGEWRSEVHFVDWNAWGRLALRCADRLHRGDGVLLTGELRQERWDDKATGEKRSRLRLVADKVQRYRVAKGKKDETEPENHSPQPAGCASPQGGEGEEPGEPEDLGAESDDVPF